MTTKYVLMDLNQQEILPSYGKFLGKQLVIDEDGDQEVKSAWINADQITDTDCPMWWNTVEEAQKSIRSHDWMRIFSCTFKIVPISVSIKIKST